MTKISLIHPSRGRPEKAKSTYDYWMSQATNPSDIEHILSLDFSDPRNEDYGMDADGKYKPFGPNSHSIIDHNDCVVEATNQAAKLATGDILVYLSDDFLCPNDWDDAIKYTFNLCYLNGQKGPLILKVDDCLQPFDADVLTIPIMNRALYERLGYFFNPIYRSMFCDQDLHNVCKNNGWLVLCPGFQFEHQHYSVGKAPRDETYTRSDANWNIGKALYERRKADGFKI